MRIYPEQLAQHLTKSLCQTYLIFGNEPLLKLEAQSAIREAASHQGFQERHQFELNNQLNWDDVFHSCQEMSLFSSQQLIEITIPESGVNAAAAKQFQQLLPLLNPDIILILIGPKLVKRQESAKWFSSFEKSGLYIQTNTPDQRFLPRFIQQRCNNLKLKADHESIQQLALWHEGNLLALVQSLDKLALLYPDGQLTLLRIEQALSQQNHYSPYQLVDAILAGKSKRTLRILNQLEGEGVEIIIILRTLQKELFQLYSIKEQQDKGIPLHTLFEQLRVWQNKRPLYTEAINRTNLIKLRQQIQLLKEIEIESKVHFSQDNWPQLALLCLSMANNQLMPLHSDSFT
ncbi:DNA polymerase III subunit delta [Vibrio sp. SS-MA-C1-2]|uniref:DNA polymerase III subunit delta n=1 Tax=Vibrio sp. SS-MA-C1-2 TaxID=2908646 RepID=UPI001F28D91E|nr:DNA polymerase III subunit delta [Vibrio sp. SS-MA-C1-2]UJF18818.1 DNA polymerase III subunit delta [Vibrio sp. SS-MA-C1-2]